MSTLAEIENAIVSLSESDLVHLERSIQHVRKLKSRPKQFSMLDLPPLDLGEILNPLTRDDGLFDEMIDGSRL